MKQLLLTIATCICLPIAILCAGVVACFSVPQITENLCRATALVDQAHFTRDQLVDVAETTRSFVAGTSNRIDIYDIVQKINKDQKTQYENLEGIDFASAPDDYSIDSKSIKHLEEVANLFANIRIAFGICSFLSVLFLILIFVFCGHSAFGRTLAFCGFIVLALLLFLIGWGIIDFSAMFNWLHSLFFKSGSWLFNEKSLLITMYPTAFWVCMGVISGLISIALSVVALIVGKIIK